MTPVRDPIYIAIEKMISAARRLLRLVMLKIASPAAYAIWSYFFQSGGTESNDEVPSKTIFDRIRERRKKRKES